MNIEPATEELRPGGAAVSISILCVDDEEMILKALRRIFRGEEFLTLTAASGPEALNILKNNPGIGLILCDQQMPGMTGSTFLQEAHTLHPDISAIVFTSSDITGALDAIRRGVAYRLLAKPWHEEELRLAVRDGLHRYHLVRENRRLAERAGTRPDRSVH